MPACLPPLAAQAAEDPDDGLLALHGGQAGGGLDVFPADLTALVDLSGKKWAHTVGWSFQLWCLGTGLPGLVTPSHPHFLFL